MPAPVLKRGRWSASRRASASARLAYREPAPTAAERPPPRLAESGRYQALREHWVIGLMRRLRGRLAG